MRNALVRAGGVPARAQVRTRVAQPVSRPFASGRVVEGSRIREIDCGSPTHAPDGVGFADGIQRWVLDGHLGLAPVVRAHVAAAVLVRNDGRFRAETCETEEFLVVPGRRVTPAQLAALQDTGLAVHETDPADRAHPIVDRYSAVQVVERRREAAERRAVTTYVQRHPHAWVVVDGPIGFFGDEPAASRAVGLIKTHDTQFLEGADLEIALTLRAGHRSSVFERTVHGRHAVYSWYLRLWPWRDEDLLHGLTRLERRPDPAAVVEADEVSRWMLAERAPLSAPEARWDRLIYPIREVETYLRARAGGWG